MGTVHIAPRLPRKATGRAAETKGHWRDARGTPGRTSDPLPVHIVSRLPRKSHRQSGGNQGTPERRQRMPEGHRGVQPSPWQCLHACHPKATGRAADIKGHWRDARGTPGRTSDPFPVHIVSRLPRKSHRQSSGNQGTPERRQRDTGAYIRPLGSAHCPTPATQKPPAERRRPRDTGGTPEGPLGVHPTRGSAHCPRLATQKRPETKGRQRDTGGHRGVHPAPWQCTLFHACG